MGRLEKSFWYNGGQLFGVRHKIVRDNGDLNEGHGSGNGEQELGPINMKEVESPVFGH